MWTRPRSGDPSRGGKEGWLESRPVKTKNLPVLQPVWGGSQPGGAPPQPSLPLCCASPSAESPPPSPSSHSSHHKGADKEVQVGQTRMHFQISRRREEKSWWLISSGRAAAAARSYSAGLSVHLIVEEERPAVHFMTSCLLTGWDELCRLPPTRHKHCESRRKVCVKDGTKFQSSTSSLTESLSSDN